jgi:hypothetical protein
MIVANEDVLRSRAREARVTASGPDEQAACCISCQMARGTQSQIDQLPEQSSIGSVGSGQPGSSGVHDDAAPAAGSIPANMMQGGSPETVAGEATG